MSKARIIESVKALDLKSIEALLDAKPSLLTVTDRQNRNLLHLACSVDCEELGVHEAVSATVVDFLLDRGLDIESPTGGDRCTVLFFAVARGRNPTLVKLLLKRGARVAAAPGDGLFAAGVTPFLACWCWKRFDAAKFLALRGANVNFQDKKGRTALHHGVEKEFDPALLEWLVKHGASPDIEDREHVSARLKASRKRDKKFLAALT